MNVVWGDVDRELLIHDSPNFYHRDENVYLLRFIRDHYAVVKDTFWLWNVHE